MAPCRNGWKAERASMLVKGDAQHGVVHLTVTVFTEAGHFGHALLDFLCHHQELPPRTAMLELGFVVEQAWTEAFRVLTQFADASLYPLACPWAIAMPLLPSIAGQQRGDGRGHHYAVGIVMPLLPS